MFGCQKVWCIMCDHPHRKDLLCCRGGGSYSICGACDWPIPRLSHKKLGSLAVHLVKPHFPSSSWKWGAHGIHKESQIISTVGVPSSSKKLQVVLDLFLRYLKVICTWNLSFSCRLGTYSYPKVPTKHRTLGTKRLANRGTVVTCIWCCHIHGARPQQLMKPPKMLKRVTVNWKTWKTMKRSCLVSSPYVIVVFVFHHFVGFPYTYIYIYTYISYIYNIIYIYYTYIIYPCVWSIYYNIHIISMPLHTVPFHPLFSTPVRRCTAW